MKLFDDPVFKNVGFLSVGKIITALIGVVTTTYLIKVLSVESYGSYRYGMALLATLVFFQDMGLGIHLQKTLSRNSKDAQIALATSLVSRLLLMVVVFAVICIVAFYSSQKDFGPFLIIMGLSFFFEVVINNSSILFSARNNMKEVAQFDILNRLLLFVFLLFALSLGAWKNLLAVAICYFAARFLVAVYSFFILKKEMGILRFKLDRQEIGAFFKGGIPFVVSGLLINFYTQADNMMLYWISDEKQVALSSVGTFILLGASFVPRIISKSTFPTFSLNRSGEEMRRAKGYLTLSLKSVIFIGSPMVLICVMLGHPILMLASSKEYIDSVALFKLFSLTTVMGWLSIILIGYLNAMNYEKRVVKVSAISLAFKVIVNIPAIYYWGALGAIAMSVLCELIILVCYAKTLWQHIERRNLIRYAVKLIAPLCLSAVAIKVSANLPVLATLAIGIGVYVVSAQLMRVHKTGEPAAN